MSNLSGKEVEIKGKRTYYSIIIDGEELQPVRDWKKRDEILNTILPEGSRSLLIEPGVYTLDKNGKLPKEANNLIVTSFDDNGNTTYGKQW